MNRISGRILSLLRANAEKPWYLIAVALLAAADAYLFVIPIAVLLVLAVAAHPRRWGIITLWIAAGNSLGAASFGFLASLYGERFLELFSHGVTHHREWAELVRVLHQYGPWGLGLVSLSPFPQHAAVAIAGLAHLPAPEIFAAVFIGAGLKYLFIAWCVYHAPRVLMRFGLLAADEPIARPLE